MAAAAQALSDKTTARRRDIALLLVLPLLAGCGGARLTDRFAAAPAGPAPSRLLVLTDGAQAIAGGDDPALVSRTASTLTETIVRGLQWHGIPAEIATTDGAAPDAARLVLALHRVEEGSRVQRMALGFGPGRSRIEVMVRLYPADPTSAPQDLLSFQGAAHGRHRPGLAMPLGVGLGTQSATAVVGAAGVAVAAMRGRGLSQDLRDLAEAVVEYTAAYFRWAGWIPEAEPPSFDGKSAVAGTAVEAQRRG